jgi:chemotaxis protein CheY-P-specific phosphatase CheC
MSESDKELLRDVFAEVVENLAFMFTEEPEEDAMLSAEGGWVCARMNFMGPFTGALALAVPVEMCPEITANVLGLDPEDELVTDQPYDALKELLNVTCGNVLIAMAGEDPVFDLTVPEVTRLDPDAVRAFRESPETVVCIVDENPAMLQLHRAG